MIVMTRETTHPRSAVSESFPFPEISECWVGENLVPGHHVGLHHLSPRPTLGLHHRRLRPELLGTLHHLPVLLPEMTRSKQCGNMIHNSSLGHRLISFLVDIQPILALDLLLDCIALGVDLRGRQGGRRVAQRSVGPFRVRHLIAVLLLTELRGVGQALLVVLHYEMLDRGERGESGDALV